MFKIINSCTNKNHRNLTLEKILSESVAPETKRDRFESFSSVDSLDHVNLFLLFVIFSF